MTKQNNDTVEKPAKGALESRWNELSTKKAAPLERARECAALTIPALLPPDGNGEADELRQPAHSIGARAVNNIAAKLLLSLFPSNVPSFKLSVAEAMIQDVAELVKETKALSLEEGKQDDKKDESIQLAITNKLKGFQRIMSQNIELMAARPKLFLVFKYLVACGNALIYMPDKKTLKVFKLHSYCVARDNQGDVLEIIVREVKTFGTLTKDLQKNLIEDAKTNDSEDKTYAPTDEIIILTQIKRRNTEEWVAAQEVGGVYIKETSGEYSNKENGKPNPWVVLRWSAISDEDYGRSLVEEYLGDLRSVNGTQRAFDDYVAVAAKIIGIINPSAPANLARKLSKAKSGDFIRAEKKHIEFMELNKYYDFKINLEMMTKKEHNLEQGFLLNSSVQRQGERVTAEEIRTVASDLEDHLGGVYSVLAQELQLPFIQLMMNYSRGDLPIPLKDIHPEVTTGLDALGRGQDIRKLSSFMQGAKLLGEDVAKTLLNPLEYLNRLASGLGVEPDNLIKTLKELKVEQKANQKQQQNAQTQELITEGGKAAIPEMIKDPQKLANLQESMQQSN